MCCQTVVVLRFSKQQHLANTLTTFRQHTCTAVFRCDVSRIAAISAGSPPELAREYGRNGRESTMQLANISEGCHAVMWESLHTMATTTSVAIAHKRSKALRTSNDVSRSFLDSSCVYDIAGVIIAIANFDEPKWVAVTSLFACVAP